MQGESWTDPTTGEELTFPTPEIVVKNYDEWFPDLSRLTRQRIERLFGGGEYTRARLVKHSLFHYKSFERLLIARCGTPIKTRRRVQQLEASGDATAAEGLGIIPRAKARGVARTRRRRERARRS